MTLAKRYTSNAHCVSNLGYHIVFCPKYRRKVLVNGVDERLKILLQQKADELGITLENMEVMPHHVHLFIRSKSTYAIHFVINQYLNNAVHDPPLQCWLEDWFYPAQQ